MNKTSKKTNLFLSSIAHLPLLLYLLYLASTNYDSFMDHVWFVDSPKVIARSHYPFKGRIITPFIINSMKSLLPSVPYEILFLLYNSIITIAINISLYYLFRLYTSESYAIGGIWFHNLTFPVFWYFLSSLADTLQYLFIIVIIYFIKTSKNDLLITGTILIGLFAKETILFTLPLWIILSKDKRKLILPVILIITTFLMQYGLENVRSPKLFTQNWEIYLALSIAPIIFFIPFWNMKKDDFVYSITIVLLIGYTLIFHFFDGRFPVLGYPIWISLSLESIEHKLKPRE